MSHTTKEEYLSAFVDGEAGSFEQHRICDQLLTDDVMREKLSNFALIGEAVRNRSQDEACVATASFLSGIQTAIADDKLEAFSDESLTAEPQTITKKKKRLFPKQSFGYAVAASVAAVAAISFQNYMGSTTDNTINTASVSEQVRVSSILPSVKSTKAQDSYLMATSYKVPDAKTRGQMNKYVAHHLKYASSSTLMPRVRAVSYSTDF